MRLEHCTDMWPIGFTQKRQFNVDLKAVIFYFIINRLLAKPGLDSNMLTCVRGTMYIIYAVSEKKNILNSNKTHWWINVSLIRVRASDSDIH